MLSTDQVLYIRASNPKIDKKVVRAFNVLGEQNRLNIFCLIIENKELCVSDIAIILKTSIPATSQQLKIMEYSGLVNRIRMGKSVCYEINTSNPLIQKVIELIRNSHRENE